MDPCSKNGAMCLVAVFALGEIRQIDGRGPIRLHMQVEMLHELDVVHEDLLADVALEGHVGLELRLQELGLALERGVEVGLQLHQLLRHLNNNSTGLAQRSAVKGSGAFLHGSGSFVA